MRWRCPDRSADLEHASLCLGRGIGACPCWGMRGALHCGCWACAWVCEPSRLDGGAVCCGPVWFFGEPDVPDRGFGAVAFGRGIGLFRACRCAGEAPWLSD